MELAHRAGRNLFFKVIGEAGSRILALVFYIIIARRLGDSGFGRYSFAYSFCALFIILIDLGINPILIRDVARFKKQAVDYIGNVNVLKSAFSLLTWLFIHLVIKGLNYPETVVRVVDLMAVVAVGTGLLEYVWAILNAFERMEYEAFLKILNKFLFLIFGVGALLIGFGLRGLLIGLIIAYLLTISAGLILVQSKICSLSFRFDFSFVRGILGSSSLVFFSLLFLTFYDHANVVLLSFFGRPEAEIGWYSSVVKLTDVLRAIPVLCVGAVFPILSILFRESKEEFNKASAGLVRLLFFLAIPIAVVTMIGSKWIIHIVYGIQYSPAAKVLAISIWAFIFVFVNHALLQILISIGKQKINIISSGIIALTGISLNIILIPRFGYIGPAISLLGSQIVFLGINLWFVSRYLPDFIPSLLKFVTAEDIRFIRQAIKLR